MGVCNICVKEGKKLRRLISWQAFSHIGTTGTSEAGAWLPLSLFRYVGFTSIIAIATGMTEADVKLLINEISKDS